MKLLAMKLLIVDDDKVTRDLLREVFEKEGYEINVVNSGEQALSVLAKHSFELILTDIRMLDLDGLQLLRKIKEIQKQAVVILMTGFGTMEGAIEAIQKGAFDYISKPFRLEDIKAVISRAAEHARFLKEPNSAVSMGPVARPKTLIGKSPLIVEVYRTLARATLSPSNVLIVGESGTGKELVARGIHENSSRKAAKFVG